jgi:hypothetical protein
MKRGEPRLLLHLYPSLQMKLEGCFVILMASMIVGI